MALVTPSRPYIKVGYSSYETKLTMEFVVDHIRARTLSAGHFISSPMFNFGGCEWVLHYYPAGIAAAGQGNLASAFLVQTSNRCADVEYFLSLVSNTGRNGCTPPLRQYYDRNNNISGFPDLVPRQQLDTIYNIDGNIQLQCHIKLVRLDRDVEVLSSGGLHEHVSNLLMEQFNCDIIFKVEEKHFLAHRLILGARSPVFRAALLGNMAEASTSLVEVVDVRPHVFEELLHFIYFDKLSNPQPSNDSVMDLLIAADKYAVHRLIALCEDMLAADLSLETFEATIITAYRHSCRWLKNKCFSFAANPTVQQKLVFDTDYVNAMAGFPELTRELRNKVLNV